MKRSGMKKNTIEKIKKINPLYLSGLLILVVLGMKHLLDTRAGAIESGDTWLLRQYFLLAPACLIGTGIIGWLLYHKKKLEHIYVVAGLFFGIVYLFVLPPLSAPDEISHYISAYQLSNHIMGKPANYKTGHVLVRSEDWFLEDVYGNYRYQVDDGILVSEEQEDNEASVLGQTLTEETYRVLHEIGLGTHVERGEGEESAVSMYPPVNTTPAAYIPQALGISIARLVGLNGLGLAYLGRLFNLLFFVGLTYLAMKRLPFGKEVLFGVALLPMTLHLSASYSYDAIIMAGMFYFTACCLDLAYEKERVRPVDVLVLAALMAIVGPCKMVYAVLMGFCLLIPVRKFGGWGRWAVSAIVVAGAWAIAMVLVNSQTIAIYAAETEAYVPWAEEAGYSLSMLLHSPGTLLRMFYNTIVWQAQYYHLTMVGAYLGNLDVVLDVPYLIVLLLTCCLLGLSFRKPGESLKIVGGRRVWIWVLCLGCVGITMLSMLIAWTPVSSLVITGVQGRYFLPFLPMLLMAIKNDFVVLTKNADRSILYLMCCANAYALMRLFSIVSMRL